MLEMIAMITMFIDHVGLVFFPNEEWLRAIGRVAFPLYVWFLVVGYKKTKNLKKYTLRLVIIALAAQLPYSYLFKLPQFNVVFTLLLALAALYVLDRVKKRKKAFLSVGLLLILSMIIPLDYGPYGILLAMIYRYMQKIQALALHALLNSLFVYGFQWFDVQMYSLIGTVLASTYPFWPAIQVNRFFYRSFYPAHIVVLLVIYQILK